MSVQPAQPPADVEIRWSARVHAYIITAAGAPASAEPVTDWCSSRLAAVLHHAEQHGLNVTRVTSRPIQQITAELRADIEALHRRATLRDGDAGHESFIAAATLTLAEITDTP